MAPKPKATQQKRGEVVFYIQKTPNKKTEETEPHFYCLFFAGYIKMAAIDNLLCLATWSTVSQVQAIAMATGVHARNADGVNGFMTASAAGNLDVARWFLKAGIDVDAQDNAGFTALIAAAVRGHVGVVKLLSKHANPNIRTRSQQAVIHLAVRNNQLRTVRTLASIPALDLNLPNQHGRTALHIAAVHGFLPIVRFLVAHPRVKSQTTDRDGFNVLHVAAGASQTQVVKYLVSTGFNLDVRCDRQTTAMFIACAVGCLDIVKHLFDRTALSTDEDGDSELHVAVKHPPVLDYLLEKKKHAVDARTADGSTALHRAVHEDISSFGVVQALIKAKAPLDATDRLGCTPFIKACHHGDVRIVRFLLEAKSDPFVLDHDGFTALHAAAQRGHLPTLKYLVHGVGLSLDAQNPKGYTPIMCALRFAQTKAVKWLAAQGADLHVRSQLGTAIDFARLFEGSSDEARSLSEWLGRSCGREGCLVRGSKKCGGCIKTRYCSKACQRLHWNDHQPDCFFSM
jgi:ankyrin repeat protein